MNGEERRSGSAVDLSDRRCIREIFAEELNFRGSIADLRDDGSNERVSEVRSGFGCHFGVDGSWEMERAERLALHHPDHLFEGAIEQVRVVFYWSHRRHEKGSFFP